MLAACGAQLDGPVVDLGDVAQRHDLEQRHAALPTQPPLDLSDPPPTSLQTVCAIWNLALAPSPTAIVAALRT